MSSVLTGNGRTGPHSVYMTFFESTFGSGTKDEEQSVNSRRPDTRNQRTRISHPYDYRS